VRKRVKAAVKAERRAEVLAFIWKDPSAAMSVIERLSVENAKIFEFEDILKSKKANEI
jgi:hypothetical protein